MHVKKHLSFSGLRKNITKRFGEIEDHRQRFLDYSLSDCLMSALAMMFLQDPSLLAFQRRLQESRNANNLKTIFQIKAIPSDTQLRDTLDEVDPAGIEIIYRDFFRSLQRGKHLESYQVLDGRYFIALDGSQYFSSDKIHCPGCLFKTTSKGKVSYSHQILQPALLKPGLRQVIPLAPEQIKNEDGTQKQDCEINASKRIVQRIRSEHPKLKIIIGGDSLYSKQPFINELKRQRMSYILVAKPPDHKIMYEFIHELRAMEAKELQSLTIKDHKGYTHQYEWAAKVPLNGDEKSDEVQYLEYTMIRKDGKTTYHNVWVTDLEVDEHNIVELVKIGRARWKIENETFNTLKNQGYHLEHNFGHGKKNLSYIFFLLNVLAFFTHQIFELTDLLYQECRSKFSSRLEFWNQLRCTVRILIFPSWEAVLLVIIDPESNQPP